MSKHTHTPGPWLYDRGIIPPDGPGRYSDVYDQEETIIARVNDLIPAGIANAHLIAAAPDLLKACRQALYALKGREHDQFLRDAIAKATGEQA